jgi:serine-type D-Ala-D-Ala carboxypeptidase (penicillin-binding protein 5/6)
LPAYEFAMRIVTGLLVSGSLLATQNASARPQYQSAAPIAYMVDMASGAVLFDKNSRRQIAPASMAKMMTTYVVFDLVTKGKLKPETKFKVRPETWQTWNNTGSTMFLKPNEQLSVADLLHGLVTLSGNDAAIVLAEGISGSETAFTKQMNATAQKLGMKDSHFGTANGWPDEGRTLTTARDLAVLGARTIQDFPLLYRQYYGQAAFRWNNVTQPNRNPILGKIAGADGVKTGHTDEAGYCFTGTAKQNGRRIMMVVAGLDSMNARANESIQFMQWGFEAWQAQPLYNAGRIVARLPVQLGGESRIDVIAPRNLALALPAKDAPRYKLIVRYNGPIKAPFRKGAEVAQLVAKFSDGTEQIMPLVAAHSVAEAEFFGRAWNGLKSLVGA